MKKIDREIEIVTAMIALYCRRKEGNRELCPECEELVRYATTRLQRCPFGEGKGTCRHCKIHCYNPKMRSRIREVMRFSGPRMIIYHPLAALRHLLGK